MTIPVNLDLVCTQKPVLLCILSYFAEPWVSFQPSHTVWLVRYFTVGSVAACNSICRHCSSCYCFGARGHCFCCLFYCALKGLQAIQVRLNAFYNQSNLFVRTQLV